MESILTSVKKALGITEDYIQFDPELIMFINMAFSVLTQLGVGPASGYMITSESETWSDFLGTTTPLDTQLEMVKTYVYLKVRLVFDPPTGSVLDAFNRQISELEWRLNVAVDPGDKTLEEIVSDDTYFKVFESKYSKAES